VGERDSQTALVHVRLLFRRKPPNRPRNPSPGPFDQISSYASRPPLEPMFCCPYELTTSAERCPSQCGGKRRGADTIRRGARGSIAREALRAKGRHSIPGLIDPAARQVDDARGAWKDANSALIQSVRGWSAAKWAQLAFRFASLAAGLTAIVPSPATAGPPFQTDDPEPVDYQHYEFYTFYFAGFSWAGTPERLRNKSLFVVSRLSDHRTIDAPD
jgi:hypothetical protein